MCSFQCGGLLTDRWLGKPEPELYSGQLNPSQRKVGVPSFVVGDASAHTPHLQYLDVILKAWGTWDLFQKLLTLLRDIGDRHGGLSIANVAVRWVLEHPFVGAVLIGMSRNRTEHFQSLLLFYFFFLIALAHR